MNNNSVLGSPNGSLVTRLLAAVLIEVNIMSSYAGDGWSSAGEGPQLAGTVNSKTCCTARGVETLIEVDVQ